MKSFKEIRENKLADITDSIRGHIGLIGPNSTVTSQEKSRAAKNVSKDHNISLDTASKFVDDYCRMKREETELGESKVSVSHATDSVGKVLGRAGAVRFLGKLKPQTDKHTTVEKINTALLNQGASPKHIAAVMSNLNKESIELDESNPFKHADDVIRKVRNKAVVANLKGDKPAEEKYSKRLTKVLYYRNKMLATESFESDKQLLDHHVTNNEPTLSNINKMHDMVRNISKTHGVSSDKIYNQVVDNASAHNKYREAASL